MTRKKNKRQKVTSARSTKTKSKGRGGSPYIKLPDGQQAFPPDLRGSSAERSLGALRYMRKYSSLTFSDAAKLWHLHPTTFHKHARSGLRTLASGRVRAM